MSLFNIFLTDRAACKIIEAELSHIEYDINEDYLEMVIQVRIETL